MWLSGCACDPGSCRAGGSSDTFLSINAVDGKAGVAGAAWSMQSPAHAGGCGQESVCEELGVLSSCQSEASVTIDLCWHMI